MSDELVVTRHGGWAEVMLNRPERKNALTGPVFAALGEAFVELSADASLNAIVLGGAGGAFCSGLDLGAFNAQPPPPWLPEYQETSLQAHLSMYRCSIPMICALERYAINAGAALALACDLVVVGEGAFLQIGEVQQGVAAPMNAAWLSLKFPEPVGARLTLIGDRVGAAELSRLGIATMVVSDGEVLDRARALATTLAGFPPSGPRANKAALRGARPADAEAVFRSAQAAARSVPRPAGGLPSLKRD
ncbi:MAG: enoyl-CoA hydratase/isomerase family protein [Dehalococcoidia bacterium]